MTDDEVKAIRTKHIEAMQELAKTEDVLEQSELRASVAPGFLSSLGLWFIKVAHRINTSEEAKARTAARATYDQS